MKFFIPLVLLILCNFSNAQDQIIEKEPLTIGDKITLHSVILKEDRVLNIYLPYSYHPDSAKKYPVIYLLDGSISEDFIHVSGIVQFASYPWINMMPESIVVGISNLDRKKNFTYPTSNKRDKKDFPSTGESENFISFLEKEVQPFISKQYNTTTEKTIVGQSLGGLLATEILFTKSHLFDNYVIISPSLWWDDESLLKMATIQLDAQKSVYIGVGKEGKLMERVALELYEKLQPYFNENPSLYFHFFENLDHGDVLHLAAYDAFQKLFSQEKPEK